MEIFNLRRPGTRIIDNGDIKIDFLIQRSFGNLEQVFIPLCVSYIIFQEQFQKWLGRREFRRSEPVWEKRLEIDDGLPGEPPIEYFNQLTFVSAESFLFYMDRMQKVSKVFFDIKNLPPKVKDLETKFISLFENVSSVRDSSAHYDERIQGLQYGKPIKADGGIIYTSALNDNRFGYTARDGKTVFIEISSKTVSDIQAGLQEILNSFTWKGTGDTLLKKFP